MHRCNSAVVACLIGLLAGASTAWAEDLPPGPQSAASRSRAFQDSQAVVPSPAVTGNIIGYKPIPSSALGLAVPSPVSAQLATAVPGAGSGAANAATGTAAARSDQLAAPGTPELPAGYMTGIVGEGLYTLGRDDIVQIEVANQPDFTGAFIVGYDGRIQYNYLGDIPVAGLSKYELQQVLEKLLAEYVRVPVVNVTIVGYNSKVVYVVGEVNRPGKFIMRGDMIKLREAILAAGLPTTRAALGRVHVIKPDLSNPRIRVINLTRILYKGQLKDDVDLAAGEIVVVPSTVLSKVNDFLSAILSPVTRAASVAALAAL